MRLASVLASAVLALVLAATAFGHAERATLYPDRDKGEVPTPRTNGPARVVCKSDSAKRVRRAFKGRGRKTARLRTQRLALVERCRYRHIQQAVDAAKSGDRILILPGVYREEPSRAVPVKDAKCQGEEYWEASGDNHQEDGRVPTYKHQVDCPNARNLIAIIGDSLADDDRECDRKCNLQMQGMGRRARDVVIEGDRLKPDVLRADRADGFQLSNVTVEQGAYNNVDLVEVNGFRLSRIVSRWAYHYGILTFTSDHGLYEDIEAYGSGDSGVYPGSGPETGCKGFGIEMRRINAYGNTLGASGTAGNGTWTHDSRFHHNAAGISQDSFAPGHPGMPQDCSKWTNNRVYSNNVNLFEDANEQYCIATPFEQRPKEHVCPVFQVVVGTGFMLYGANDNVFENNFVYDQHRNAFRLFGVPAALRGEDDPANSYDTSHGNKFVGNTLGVRPDGTVDLNGTDVFWDEQGIGNCWERNRTAPGRGVTSDPAVLPDCRSGGSINPAPNSAKLAADTPCAFWHPRDNTDPPGCTWFTTPPDPGDGSGGGARTSFSRPMTPPDLVARRSETVRPGANAQGPLAWEGEAQLKRPAELPDDRVLTGRIVNRGDRSLDLDALHARVLDDGGTQLRATVTFAEGPTHGLYGEGGWTPKEAMPDFQARRMGMRKLLAPGEATTFTVAWRGGSPTRVDLGSATVAVPL